MGMGESNSHHPDLRKEGIVMEKVFEFFKNAVATFSSFTHEPEEVRF